jgi:hypothetical protein
LQPPASKRFSSPLVGSPYAHRETAYSPQKKSPMLVSAPGNSRATVVATSGDI